MSKRFFKAKSQHTRIQVIALHKIDPCTNYEQQELRP
jgi:hypothetical protein